MEIEKLIDRYFLALEKKIIAEIYNKQKLIFSINYISAEFEQREKLNY